MNNGSSGGTSLDAPTLDGESVEQQEMPPAPDESLIAAVDQHRAQVDEAYAAYDELRGKCPVVHSEAHGGYYLLLRHADVRGAALDWKNFSSARGGVSLPTRREGPRLPALEHDPPEHGEWRKLYTDAIAPAALRQIEPEIERIADRLIDTFAGKGSVDLVRKYCEPLPVLGISAVLGLTGKKPEEMREIAVALTDTAGDPAQQNVMMARLGEFILGEVHDRRANPRDDYLTKIALAEIGGRPMDDGEMTLFMVGFLVAGHETTASALAGLIYQVLKQPELKERLLEDNKVMAAAIEEAVRISSPFHGFSRTTTQAVEVAGTLIPEDETVRLCFASANRDPAVFAEPAAFAIDRPSNPHVGFGAGRHACAGAPFARVEMRVALRRLLERLPDICLSEDKLDWRFSGGMMTIPGALRAQFEPQT